MQNFRVNVSSLLVEKAGLAIVGGLIVHKFDRGQGRIWAALESDKTGEVMEFPVPDRFFAVILNCNRFKAAAIKAKYKTIGLTIKTRIESRGADAITIDSILGMPILPEFGGRGNTVAAQNGLNCGGLVIPAFNYNVFHQVIPEDFAPKLWTMCVAKEPHLEVSAIERNFVTRAGQILYSGAFFHMFSPMYFLTQNPAEIIGVEEVRWDTHWAALIRYSNGVTHWTDEAIDCLPQPSPSATPAPTPTPAPKETENLCPKTGQPIIWAGCGMYAAAYKSAYILGGDTYPQKNKIKECGAKWNAALTAQDGSKFGAWVLTPQMLELVKQKF